MAAINFTPISLYYTTTASAVPSAGNLVNGELAMNITDKKLYAKDNTGSVFLLASESGSTGTVSSVSVVSANGFAGTVATSTTTPAITLTTSITGVLKGNGTAISAATAGTDYVAPGGALGTPSSGTATNLTGLPLSTGVTGTLPVANGGTGATSLTANNVILGNGTSAVQVVAPGSSGNVLTSNGTTWQSTTPAAGVSLSANNTWTGTQTFAGTTSVLATVLTNAAEVATVSGASVTGSLTVDVTTSSVAYYQGNATGNWSINIRGSSGTALNSMLSTGQSITIAVMVTQGSTAYYNTSVQVDGTTSGVTTKWQGGTAPTSGNASSIDAYTYTIIKTASATYTVLASQVKFA